jgi:hypothetical protein
MKLVLHKFKTIKFDEHESRTLQSAVSTFAINPSSFLSESEIAVSSAKCVLRDGIAKARWKSFI